jgi:hypothetical protein
VKTVYQPFNNASDIRMRSGLDSMRPKMAVLLYDFLPPEGWKVINIKMIQEGFQ